MLCLKRALYGLFFGLILLSVQPAEAQYKNNQFGFEGSYMFVGGKLGLKSHGALFALRGAYKGSDHWWFSSRLGVSFRGELAGDRTAVLLHVMPIDVRYYLQTDRIRPFVGVSNAFTQVFNTDIKSTLSWGPGLNSGIEFFLRRDLFLGIQAEAFWMFVFQGEDTPQFLLSAQLNFFL